MRCLSWNTATWIRQRLTISTIEGCNVRYRDHLQAKDAAPHLQRLEDLQDRLRDDFAANQVLRQAFRVSLVFRYYAIAPNFFHLLIPDDHQVGKILKSVGYKCF